MSGDNFEDEVKKGRRFQFGNNWRRFLSVLNDDRIREAERSLTEMLETHDLHDRKFLDIGSGSGLFSLAARRLGADVHSFDYDPQSVACTRVLKDRFFPDDKAWRIEQGSALDTDYLASLGQFDVVYSWGVLHHTGDMWKALGNVIPLVRPGGKLFISIYNDQGGKSRRWRKIKSIYCSGTWGRILILAVFIPYFIAGGFLVDLMNGKNPIERYARYKNSRGMSRFHDWIDWLGGYPFEVAKPEDIFVFYRKHDFTLARLTTCGGGLGCNQFVFRKSAISHGQ